MKWKVFQLYFRVASPLHIGWRRVGNCWQCRPYLPAYPLLCALAVRVTERGERFQTKGNNCYRDNLDWLKEHIRITYFFPAFQEKTHYTIFIPRYRQDGALEYIKVEQDPDRRFPSDDASTEVHKAPPEEFDYLFLGTQSRTALAYPERTALTGALYHFDFLRPYTRSHEGLSSRSVYLCGYVFFDEEASKKLLVGGKQGFHHLFDRLQVGGERRLGWGLLRLEKSRECTDDPGPKPFGFNRLEFVLSGFPGVKVSQEKDPDGVQNLLEKEAIILAHSIPIKDTVMGVSLKGPVEIMVGRESDFKNERLLSGYKVRVYGEGPLFLPGSRIEADKSGVYFKITDEGLWEI